MQCARALLSSVARSAVQYISTLSHKWHDFRKKKLSNKKWALFFSLQRLSETFFILKITERDMIIIFTDLHVKYTLFLSDFIETRIFLTDCRKILKYQISQKSVQLEPRFFYAEGWTEGWSDRRTDRR